MIQIAYDPIYAHPLPENHRFPMLKYELIPQQLLHEGTCHEGHFFRPGSCAVEVVLATHDAAYFDKLLKQQLSPSEQRKIGFEQSEQLIQRELIITQGTIDIALHALKHGAGLNVAGGTHHAFADRGEGFCLLNDMAVASNYLLGQKLCRKILIIDLDVHQGNGTSSETYLALLHEYLLKVIASFQPDFAFYLAGVDILDTDKFGKLQVSLEACKQRDAYVFELLKQLGIPVAVALGGGYSPDIKVIVEAHCNTFRLAVELFD